MDTFYITDVGRRRNSNQDYMYVSERPVGKLPNLFIVADGMGGYAAGDLASKMAVETIVSELEAHAGDDYEASLKKAITLANTKIRQKALSDPMLEGMGTTVVAAIAAEDRLIVANVGDSRLYLLHDTLLRQITTDHSYVQEMVRMGRLKGSDASKHPDKNIITRAVGAEDDIDVDIFKERIAEGDLVLMCTDGLTNMVSDERIREILDADRDLTGAGNFLTEQANENGGRDNITVVLVRI